MSEKKNIVREIFERPKEATGKISAIFTHFRSPTKAVLFPKANQPPSAKALPAAIDIGTSTIKLFQLGQDLKGGLEIINLDRQNSSADKKEALKRIVERNQIGSRVLAAISAKDLQIYNLSFPRMPEAELNQALKWKLTQLRPFGLNLEELVYDSLSWGDSAGLKSSQQKILLACVPKSLISNTVALFAEAGLEVIDVLAGPLSLANLDKFAKSDQVKNEITIWLDLGNKESTLVITKSGILLFSRNLSLTSQSLTKHLAQHFRLNSAQAEELKNQYGLSSWSADKKMSVFSQGEKPSAKPKDKAELAYYGLISSLENLVVDIEHSFKYFSYQVSQSQITRFDRLILCGGASELKNLDKFLSAKLKTRVEKCNPFSWFNFSSGLESKKRIFLSSPGEFAVAAAMAVSPKIEKTKLLNLTPKQRKRGLTYLKEHLKEKPVRVAAVVLSLAIFLIVLQMVRVGFYAWRMNSLVRGVKVAQSRLGSLQSNQLKLAKKEARLLEQKAKLEGRLNFLNQGTRRPRDFSGALAKVASLLPEEIWVNRLTYLEKKLNITGSTPKMNLVIELLETLKASEKFSSASFSYTQKEPDREVYNFEIVAEIKP